MKKTDVAFAFPIIGFDLFSQFFMTTRTRQVKKKASGVGGRLVWYAVFGKAVDQRMGVGAAPGFFVAFVSTLAGAKS